MLDKHTKLESMSKEITLEKTRHKHLSLSKYCLEYCHDFDWNNIKMLDEKIIFKKHLIYKKYREVQYHIKNRN